MLEYNNPSTIRTSAGKASIGLILVLLLLGLLAFSFWYPREDGRTYGDVALLEAQNFTAKAMRKARRTMDCVTQGCKDALPQAAAPATTDVAVATAETTGAAPTPTPLPAVPATAQQGESASLPVFRTNPILPPAIPQGPMGAPEPQPTAPHPMTAQAPLNPPLGPQVVAPFPETQAPFGNPYPMAPGPFPFGQMQASPASPTGPAASPLDAARRAMAERRYPIAVSLYRQQLSAEPDNIDAYGELGNALLLMQRPNEASQSYYEAATRLLDRGMLDTATPLLLVIDRHEPMLAGLLRQKAARLSTR